jgi:hypothetical protein
VKLTDWSTQSMPAMAQLTQWMLAISQKPVSIDRRPQEKHRVRTLLLLLLLSLWGVKEKKKKGGKRDYYSGFQGFQCGRVTCHDCAQSLRIVTDH